MKCIDSGLYLRGADDDPEPRVEVRDDGTHVYLDAPKPAKVRDSLSGPEAHARSADAGVAGEAYEVADPRRPMSGQGPSNAGFTCDFRRGRDGRWVGQDRAGRRFRLRISHDGETYRVRPDEDRPWSVKMGDKALADPSKALSDEQEAAGLARWSQRLSEFWARKPAA